MKMLINAGFEVEKECKKEGESYKKGCIFLSETNDWWEVMNFVKGNSKLLLYHNFLMYHHSLILDIPW